MLQAMLGHCLTLLSILVVMFGMLIGPKEGYATLLVGPVKGARRS